MNVRASLRFFGTYSKPKPVGPALDLKRLSQVKGTAQEVLTAERTIYHPQASTDDVLYHGVHHVALICHNLETAMQFYQGVLGLSINPDRPHHRLPYRGAWLWIGPEMIHLMELPNPDPLAGRPDHGGRDRHFCLGVESIAPLAEKLDAAGVPYTRSMSGRPAIFFRDPDMNTLECAEVETWRG